MMEDLQGYFLSQSHTKRGGPEFKSGFSDPNCTPLFTLNRWTALNCLPLICVEHACGEGKGNHELCLSNG